MANLPNDTAPIEISYKYPDGRVFSVQGEELEKFLKNMGRAAGAVGLRSSSFGKFDPIDWIVEYPAHDARP